MRCNEIPFEEYREIITDFLEELDENLLESENPKSRILRDKLKQLDTWKRNIFILYLHFGKTKILAEMLGIEHKTITHTISQIKKSLR